MNKWRILYVDDEPLNIKLLHAIFSSQPVELVSSLDGKDAWEKIQKEPFDLILLDIMIPEVNGFEICKRIKDDPQRSMIPVILVTSLTEKKFRLRGIEAGCDDYLVKPYDKDLLLARVQAFFNSKCYQKEYIDLQAQLDQSIVFGMDLIRNFNPLIFNFIPALDSLALHILETMKSSGGYPQMLIIGYKDNSQWSWHQYEIPYNELLRNTLSHPLDQCLPALNKESNPFLIVDQPSSIPAELAPLINSLEQIPSLAIRIQGIQGYISDTLTILLLNPSSNSSPGTPSLIRCHATIAHFLTILTSQTREAESAIEYLLHTLVRAAESIGSEQKNHILRVGEYCAVIARHLKMPEIFVSNIRLQALTHDIGNLLIPHQILNKPGELNFEEWEIVRRHSQNGAYIIGDHFRLKMAKTIALSHHENWDGSGYPNWLEGQRIPIEGRITAIADRYDALRTPRSYKMPMDHETAKKLIQVGNERTNPKHFDPQILHAFEETADQFAAIYDEWREEKKDNEI